MRVDPTGEWFFTATVCGVALWKIALALYNYVNERLRTVSGNRAVVEAMLAALKEEILARSVTGIRWD